MQLVCCAATTWTHSKLTVSAKANMVASSHATLHDMVLQAMLWKQRPVGLVSSPTGVHNQANVPDCIPAEAHSARHQTCPHPFSRHDHCIHSWRQSTASHRHQWVRPTVMHQLSQSCDADRVKRRYPDRNSAVC